MAEVPVPEDGGSGNDILSKWEHQPLLHPLRRLLFSRKMVLGLGFLILMVIAGATPAQLMEAGKWVLGLVGGGALVEDFAEKWNGN